MTAVLDAPPAAAPSALLAAAPAPASLCASFIGARRMRVTMLDTCGRPKYGPRAQVTTSGFLTIEITPEVEAGESYKAKNAGGELCVNDRGQDAITWLTYKIEFCEVDPELFLMMSRSWKRVTDASRQTTTGFRIGEKVTDLDGFAIECWPKVSGKGAGQACLQPSSSDDFEVNGYLLLPFCVGMAPDAMKFENAPTTWTLQGRTKAGSLWGKGPYKVTRDLAGAPAVLLDPIDPGFNNPTLTPPLISTGDPDHFHAEIVTVKPPEAACGAQPLWNPDATAPAVTITPDAGANKLIQHLVVTNAADVGQTGTVDWGDDTAVAPIAAGKADHTYAAAGNYSVIVTASNGSAPVTKPIVVTAAAGFAADDTTKTDGEKPEDTGTSGPNDPKTPKRG